MVATDEQPTKRRAAPSNRSADFVQSLEPVLSTDRLNTHALLIRQRRIDPNELWVIGERPFDHVHGDDDGSVATALDLMTEALGIEQLGIGHMETSQRESDDYDAGHDERGAFHDVKTFQD